MTVIVVGDADPALVVDLIKRDFGGGPTVPRPAPRDVGVKATAGPRAIVVTDSELTRAEVSIVRIEPPREPATTVALKRRELVELIGAWTFGRRMNAEIAAGKVAFLDADASVSDWPGTMRMTTVEASGRPGTWRAMLTDLGTALQRARLHGFSEREVEDARQALIAEAEEAVQRETTRPARDVLRQINGAVTRQEPIMSAAQSLALLRGCCPGSPPPRSRTPSPRTSIRARPSSSPSCPRATACRPRPSCWRSAAPPSTSRPTSWPRSRGRRRSWPRCPRAAPWSRA